MTALEEAPPKHGLGIPGVLIVDDRADNLLALEAVLEPLGFDLVRAASGREALGHLLDREFAVVVLDVQMPEIDGFETARLIKARERTRHLPIIFLTAISGDPEHFVAGYRTGAVDYIHKPFEPELLRAKVSVFAELWRRGKVIEDQRRRLTEQLAQLERLNWDLEQSNSALERLASLAAEELQEPLANVAGFMELLATRYGAEMDGEQAELVRRARSSAARLHDRVLRLLEVARFERAGGASEDVDLSTAVRDAVTALGSRVTAARVTWGPLPTVRGDRRQLTRLFELLLDGAVHRAGPGVSVKVEADGAVISVRDDGPSTSDTEHALLFSGYVDAPVARAGVCRRIVESHGGTVWTEGGEGGRGAAICFTLPGLR